MTYRVKGTLKLPDGSPAANCEIEFVSRKNLSPTVQGSKTNILTSATGYYDVTLELGEYAVIIYAGGTYPSQAGIIVVLADTAPGQDLPTLLNNGELLPATPDYMQQIQAWLAAANEAASDSAASAAASEASAQAAAASAATTAAAVTAHEAKPGAHAISGITGLQEALDSKENSGAAQEAASGAVAAHKAESNAHSIENITGLRDELDSLAGGAGSSGVVSREALRRSYAEAGLNLVDGSFEDGGALTSVTDVLLYKQEGKVYSWGGTLPKTVPKDSTPANSGGIAVSAWVNRSSVLATGGDLVANLSKDEVQISGATILNSTAFGKMHVCSGTTANYTVTLPPVSGNKGNVIGIRLAGISTMSKLVTLDGSWSEMIDNQLTRVMWADESAILLCDGIQWKKISGRTIPMYFRAYLSANQPITANTPTKIQLNAVSPGSNPSGVFDAVTGRVNIPRQASWTFQGGVNFSSGISGGVAIVQLNKNGENYQQFAFSHLSSTTNVTITGSAFNIAAEQDYYELIGYITVSTNITGAGYATFLSGQECYSW